MISELVREEENSSSQLESRSRWPRAKRADVDGAEEKERAAFVNVLELMAAIVRRENDWLNPRMVDTKRKRRRGVGRRFVMVMVDIVA